MTEHFGFAEEEWDLVLEVPLDIYLCMVHADVTVESIADEYQALEIWLERAVRACGDSPWMKAAVESAHRASAAQARGGSTLSEPEIIAKLAHLGELLEQYVPTADARAFKRLLLSLAEQVAAASGGIVPGASHVSKVESDLIWKIRVALALT